MLRRGCAGEPLARYSYVELSGGFELLDFVDFRAADVAALEGCFVLFCKFDPLGNCFHGLFSVLRGFAPSRWAFLVLSVLYHFQAILSTLSSDILSLSSDFVNTAVNCTFSVMVFCAD